MTIQISPGVLENNHVRLEPLAEHHRQAVRVAADDPELWRFHFQNQHGRTFDHWFDLSLAGAIKGDTLARCHPHGQWIEWLV